jgi:Xaa-Pro aminopeptidase
MKLWATLAALCAVSAAAAGEYQARRAALINALPNATIVLFGRTEADAADLRSGFYQDPNFYYLTGWLSPGAALLLDGRREVLFLPPHNRAHEIWTGIHPAASDPEIAGTTGFSTVLPLASLEQEVRASLETFPQLFATGPDAADKLKKFLPGSEAGNPDRALARLRMKKTPEEIALLETAIDASIAAHRAAWKQAAPGIYEYQVAATMQAVYLGRGCERSAYAPIVASGPNSVFLHYSLNKRRMERGDVLLMDVGAECSGYAADITRTIPVGGRFSPRQREIYEIVLGAQKAALAAVKPGATLGRTSPNSVYKAAYHYINTHGEDLHGQPLGKYFTHGISHHIGLEVHDAAEPGMALEPGMVISVEPGIYIPEENIGIRIEDMVLVTHDGARLLTAALPREAREIERAVAK